MRLDALLQSIHEQDLHVRHVIVRQDGEITAEHHFVEDTPVMLWSASKSIISLAIGIAVHAGFFDIHDKIADYFPGARQQGFDQVAIRDLLCMATGHAECPFTKALDAGGDLNDVEQLFFSEPLAYPPGTHFLYNNTATYMLSKLISRTAGGCLLDFLRPWGLWT